MTGSHDLDWAELRRLGRSLNLPAVQEGQRSDGAPCLRAHGRVWTWWDRCENAPGFRLPADERAFLIAADPFTFYVPADEIFYNNVLARPDRVSRCWILANLSLGWRALAPSAFAALFAGEGPPVAQLADDRAPRPRG
ncbi:MAG: hypothetical protein COW55_09765 [Rhodobacteraceae bacterium CG17_big_fil_post_rev_8_21_14_2_50_65_11]|nr:MAG: hypothetical protein COW55_09765 [Rhodobacteraceae bacterium CG17_big_fil_post_rev_8_21_14_2_50_65_11]